MTRRHWRNAHADGEEYYGLGIISGTLKGWDWFGHSGGLPGYISRTAVVPEQDLTITVLTNDSNGWARPWVDGAIHILREFSQRGPPTRQVQGWTGRWWGQGGPDDYIPLGNRVLTANPQAWNPFLNATEIEVTGRDKGRVSLDDGYGNQGEAVLQRRDQAGKVVEIKLRRLQTASGGRNRRGNAKAIPVGRIKSGASSLAEKAAPRQAIAPQPRTQ
jgi:hypothetical protein